MRTCIRTLAGCSCCCATCGSVLPLPSNDDRRTEGTRRRSTSNENRRRGGAEEYLLGLRSPDFCIPNFCLIVHRRFRPHCVCLFFALFFLFLTPLLPSSCFHSIFLGVRCVLLFSFAGG